MNVNSDVLAALLTNYQAQFGADYNKSLETQNWKQVCHIVNSENLFEKVPFSGAPPRVQDTTDGVLQFEDIRNYLITVENREFQAGWEISRSAWADDRIGLYASKPSEFAEAAADHPGEYIWGLIEANGLAYDGTAFYSASRTIGASATINNILAGGGVQPVDLLADLNTIQVRMFNFQTDKGRAMKRQGNLITCSIDLFQAWFDALAVANNTDTGAATRVPPGTTTFTAGRYTVTVNPEATDTNNWQLHSVEGSRKPFVMTDRETPHLEGTSSVESYEWRIEKKSIYSTYGRYGRGYGDPRLSILVTN